MLFLLTSWSANPKTILHINSHALELFKQVFLHSCEKILSINHFYKFFLKFKLPDQFMVYFQPLLQKHFFPKPFLISCLKFIRYQFFLLFLVFVYFKYMIQYYFKIETKFLSLMIAIHLYLAFSYSLKDLLFFHNLFRISDLLISYFYYQFYLSIIIIINFHFIFINLSLLILS